MYFCLPEHNITEMKSKQTVFIVSALFLFLFSCNPVERNPEIDIVFLHHSTGGVIWRGDANSVFAKIARRISNSYPSGELPSLIKRYNKINHKNYQIKEMTFPKANPYGWNNFPYDYYNIWVKNAGEKLYMEEPTLEILTKEYQIIMFKHCFPVSNIQENEDTADINSQIKAIDNYRLHYEALKDKFHAFPDTRFILFTGAVQVQSRLSEDEAKRAKEFFNWVTEEWDQPDDNIYIWDFYQLQTEGGLYFKEEYAVSTNDSHPDSEFASNTAKLLYNRIIDVIENNGTGTQLTGK